MAINLAEAVKLKSILTKKIHALQSSMHSAAFVIVEKGEEPKLPTKSLQQYVNELNEVRTDSRKLDALIYRANIDNTLTFEGETMPIVEAIELATQLRAQALFAKQLGEATKEEYFHSSGDTVLYRVALFEPLDFMERGETLEKLAHRLSNAINAANYSIMIDFDDTKYF